MLLAAGLLEMTAGRVRPTCDRSPETENPSYIDVANPTYQAAQSGDIVCSWLETQYAAVQ